MVNAADTAYWEMASPWIWKGVSATLWSGRYTFHIQEDDGEQGLRRKG